MSKPVITVPTKTMTWEEFYEKTDNANKLMDRVWYCLAVSDPGVAKQKVFWEHWYWSDKGDNNDDKELNNKLGQNHTLTIETDGKEVDYPIWPVKFDKTMFKMYPAIDLKCMIIAPFGIGMTPVQFPTDDSRTEFRVDFANVMGKKMYFIFALDPLMAEETKSACYEKLETEHGVKKEWFHEIQWEKGYQIGSTGEPDINPKK
ncbi:expressed unknown protein [Seminavis robusta]|uniref:Uncharacterized protein n=1 Tax=Seminavis robusta TaxID=568900 RepID=A0A9N8HDS8_9STRA|nr:expressed unknown protein [Seminavis robusta]|eukprot:Sro356_g125270.1 n/a (203) ;mRNA; r:16758-17366